MSIVGITAAGFSRGAIRRLRKIKQLSQSQGKLPSDSRPALVEVLRQPFEKGGVLDAGGCRYCQVEFP